VEHPHATARVPLAVRRVFVYERRCCGRCCLTDAQSPAPTPAAAGTATAPSAAPIVCTVTTTGYFPHTYTAVYGKRLFPNKAPAIFCHFKAIS